MVRLFIENKEVELDNTVAFAITKQFEDLTNPTDIINDWSKTVSIPFTQKNNELFGHIYNPDKVIVDGGTVGIYFNPLLKLNFRLEWDGAILMTGYAKMNEVKQNKGKGTYELTLFGELGRVFGEMQKITFDSTSELTDYIIDGSKYVDEYITKELVYSAWTASAQTQEQLYPKYFKPTPASQPVRHPAYKVTDIIGFAPNNSFSGEFDYKSYEYLSGRTIESKTFQETLGSGFTKATGIEPETAIPNGMLPREIGEYRSYLQLPYIYWNKLFRIFKEKAEEVTGYSIELDNSWFNKNNPYWYNLVYMLKGFVDKKGNSYNNTYISENTSATTVVYSAGVSDFSYNPSIHNDSWHDCGYIHFTTVDETLPILDDGVIRIDETSMLKFSTIPVNFSFFNNYSYLSIWRQNTSIYPIWEFSMYDEDDNYIEGSKKVIGACITGHNPYVNQTVSQTVDEFVYTPSAVTCNYNETYTFHLDLPYNKTFTKYDSETYKMKMRFKWLSPIGIGLALQAHYDEEPPQDWQSERPVPMTFTIDDITITPIDVAQNIFHSKCHFTLNELWLWNGDYKIFDEILKYCKMFRIGVFVDDIQKEIKFIPLSTYFQSYTIEDWTNKVDKSKDFVIKPVTFENKYVLFNYKDLETELGHQYKQKYGVNYGDYRLVTDYNFNNETTELFDNISGSMTKTDNVLSWENLFTYNRIIYSFPSELYINTMDKEKKFVDTFGSFYFHNGLANFSTEDYLKLRTVKLSDDTGLQLFNNTYLYAQQNDYMISCPTYPALDIICGDNMCVFNVPKENYTYLDNYADKKSIYYNIWENYINERYNIQNKQIICYMDIKPSDYNNFEFNHFVKIGNQLCMVNKIFDYDVTNNDTTKVELITIQDINGYTNSNYTDNN